MATYKGREIPKLSKEDRAAIEGLLDRAERGEIMLCAMWSEPPNDGDLVSNFSPDDLAPFASILEYLIHVKRLRASEGKQ
jgi:hypothetical protein